MTRRIPGGKSATAAAKFDGPTSERHQRGPTEQLPRPIADETGRTARPYRAVDTLATMERRGSITAGMRQAAEDFRFRFVTAQLDPLRALDYSRPRDGGRGRATGDRGSGLRVEGAREHVWRHRGSRRSCIAWWLMSVARGRLGALAQRMGIGTGVEWAPDQSRGCVGYLGSCAWRTRNVLWRRQFVAKIELCH